MITADEEWREFEENKNYMISSWGRVYSLKSKREMKGCLETSRFGGPYKRFELSGGKRYFGQYLVGITFKKEEYLALRNASIPTKRPIMEHRDCNTLNNNVNNIFWDTQSNNIKRWHDNRVANIFNGESNGKIK